MTAFNASKFIREALDSILNQKFDGHFEVLCADDCSTDNTPYILSEYERDSPGAVRIFLNKTNLGCSSNYASLTSYASGKYLAFCDADDI